MRGIPIGSSISKNLAFSLNSREINITHVTIVQQFIAHFGKLAYDYLSLYTRLQNTNTIQLEGDNDLPAYEFNNNWGTMSIFDLCVNHARHPLSVYCIIIHCIISLMLQFTKLEPQLKFIDIISINNFVVDLFVNISSRLAVYHHYWFSTQSANIPDFFSVIWPLAYYITTCLQRKVCQSTRIDVSSYIKVIATPRDRSSVQ